MKKIIIYSEIDWNFLDQRHHHLARYFASKGYEVEFVERVYSRIPSIEVLFKKLFTKSNTIAKKLDKNIQLRRSLFLPNTLSFFALINYFIWILYERNKQQDAFIYSFVDNPIIIGGILKNYSKYKKAFFDIIHNWWEFPWNKSKHRTMVENCINLFDKIITDSPKIQKSLRKKNIDSHLMLPGVNELWFETFFNKSFKNIRPVFFGNLRTNSDLGLIKIFSKIYGLDVYGIIDSELDNNFEGLNYKGSIQVTSLPKVISNYNTILLPYDDKSFSSSISPAKFYEALSTGCLIVTRANFEELPGFKEFCLKLEDNINMYPSVIINKIKHHNDLSKSQVNFAKKNTWEIRFKNLEIFLGI